MIISSHRALSNHLGQVVQRAISANLRLTFNPGFFFSYWKAFSGIIFSILLRSSNHHVVDTKNYNKMSLFFNLSNLNSNFALTLGYFNPALNNSALKITNFFES